ncbi:uncharacterized protein LOC122512172 [Leptopilina heterotoma]|uniref:uncharacterized protein LOC122512172 n=1 Tax=Leptopilina heterotoma TaxID=63436 RepID=UPI001CAA2C57|nr:uncharacterized protein LOC122512172 [Leptopilina heterotoma]
MPADNNVQLQNQIAQAVDDALSTRRQFGRPPAYIPADPELWISLMERYFKSAKVTSDSEKFDQVVQNLDPRVTVVVRDLVVNVPETDAYETLKAKLMKRLGSTQEQKTRQLLEREELGDRKPSQFLRHLQSLAGTAVTDSVIKTLWLGRLPPTTQVALAGHSSLSLEQLADVADTISELGTRPSIAQVSSTSSEGTLVENVGQLVLSLREEIASLRKEFNDNRGRPSNNHRRSRSRSKSRGRNDESGICWYHSRHGQKALKCTKPCNYESGNAAGSR